MAKCHCWHKKPYIFHVFTERLYKSLFYKFFCTNLSQVVVLRRFYTERFLCNTICLTLVCLISSFHSNLKRQNSSNLLTLSWRRPLSYRKQSIDLLGKILTSLTKSKNRLSRNYSTLCFLFADAQYLITKFMIIISYNKGRSSHLQLFSKIAVPKNFAIFAREHLWWILFLKNIFNKNTYFEKHLRMAAFEI